MEYRSLTGVPTECIHEAFLQAFSDYQVPMKMSLKSFERLLRRNGFRPELSAGAFADGSLVGLVLNGMRPRDGVWAIYDTGTGVAPAYRGAGVGDGLLKYVNELCAKSRIDMYVLEVIQSNERAVNLYKKQGFRMNRELNCYSLRGRPEKEAVASSAGAGYGWQLRRTKVPDEVRWEFMRSFWDYSPSWQNSVEAACAVPDSFVCTLAECEGEPVGYGLADQRNGDIVQLAVARPFRRRGVATSILRDLQDGTQGSGMTALNVDARDEGLNAFLRQRGFRVYVTQYEMIKAFNPDVLAIKPDTT